MRADEKQSAERMRDANRLSAQFPRVPIRNNRMGQIIIALRPIRSYLEKENPGYLAVHRDLSFFRSNVPRTIQLNAGAVLSVCVAAVSEE